MKKIYFLSFILFLINSQSFSQTTLISQFDFNNNLNDNFATSTVSLTNMASTTYSNGVLNFTANASNSGGGLGLSVPDASFTEDDYSIALDFKLSETFDYAKILDFKDRSVDAGLYFRLNLLRLYPLSYGVSPVNNNTLYTVLLTRKAADDSVKVYIIQNNNLITEIFEEDLNGDYTPVLVGTDRVFHLFLDDTGFEYADSGAVRSIRLWNGVVNINDVCNSVLNSTISPISSTLCSGNSATISVSGSPEAFNSYTFTPGPSISTSVIITPSATTTYTIIGDNYSTSCFTPTTAITLTVFSTPNINISSNAPLMCLGQTATITANGSAASFSWSTGSSATVIAVSPSVTTSYTLVATNGLCSTSNVFTQSVTTCTDLNEIENSKIIRLYPNPNNGIFTIETDFNLKNAELVIYNTIGKIVLKEPLTHNKLINLSNYSKGLYFIKVTDGRDLIYSHKIITQ